MVTRDELLQSLATSAKRTMDDGVIEFRENEDSAKLIKPNEYAQLLRALAEDEVGDALDGSSSEAPACKPKFASVV